MEKKEFIAASIKAMRLAGVTCRELKAYLQETDTEAEAVSFEIVYADDSVSAEHINGKEIKGVIFVLEGRRVFISARYAPKVMNKRDSEKYCNSITVKGQPCTEGFRRYWVKCGLLHRYHEQINFVMEKLGLEQIDDRWIWSSSVFDCHYGESWSIYPVSGDAYGSHEANYRYVRPIYVWD